jgi:hypothetical protein
MAWNKLVLNGQDQEISLGFDVLVVGTGAAETLTFEQGINSIFGAGDGDQVNLHGSIENYDISMSGNKIIFTSLGDGSKTELLVGGTSMVQFDEGVAELSMSFGAQGPQMALGDAVILDGETLADPADSVFGITGPQTISMDDLEGLSDTTAFDAGAGDFTFMLDAEEDFATFITGFDEGDTLSFDNSPTGGAGDFNVLNPAFGDGEAVVEVGANQVNLLGLASDNFNNAGTFMDIYGMDALAFA